MKQELVFEAPRRALPPRHLADLDAEGRAAAVAELGLPAFRAKQLAQQYYGRLLADPQQMTDLPAAVRDTVADALFPKLLTVAKQIECDAGETRKTLWRAHDGTTFESVLMRYPNRNTVCISSQAGCGMACPFCATGQGGLTRNLSTAEILEQVRAAAVTLRDEFGDRLSNVVFMGMRPNQVVNLPDALLLEIGYNGWPVGIVPGIDQHRLAIRQLNQNRICLTNIEKVDFKLVCDQFVNIRLISLAGLLGRSGGLLWTPTFKQTAASAN